MYWIICIFAIVIVAVLGKLFRSQGRDDYIKKYKFPQGLHRRLSKHHPNLTDAQFQQVSDALRQFFLIHLRSGKKLVSMPSQVTDDLWHEFILYTQAYQTFCQKAFGQFLHHTPAAALSEKQKKSNVGLRRSWVHACQIENISTVTPRSLPLIFAVDALLNIPNGFHYVTDCKKSGLVASNSANAAIYCGGDFVSASSSDGATGGCAGDGVGDSCNSGCSSCSGGGSD